MFDNFFYWFWNQRKRNEIQEKWLKKVLRQEAGWNRIEEANKLNKLTTNICKMTNRLLPEIQKSNAICKEHNLTADQFDMVMHTSSS